VPKAQKVGRVSWASVKWKPARATGVKVRYSSSKPGVVAVDKAGRITAKAPGKATVTVKAAGKSKRIAITVS
jgi:uncharacterized protein YjdB